jgi:menaquinone-dependent protoporphyrinogen oxidase
VAVRTLVGYWSGTGCTEGVAQRIGAKIRSAGAQADVRPLDDAVDVAGYDAVVVGSSVRAHSWHARANRWVAKNADMLGHMPVWFFTVGAAMIERPENAAETRSATDKLISKTGVSPRDIGVFAGWNEPTRFNAVERLVMRIARAPQGDHRDWNAIDGWADAVASQLVEATSPRSAVLSGSACWDRTTAEGSV